MTSVYPESLFHFTKDKDNLYGIIHDMSFKLSYAREKLDSSAGEEFSFIVPMVSFCDLKLSEIRPHMKKYGASGIGLSKEWAAKAGLSPVFYMNKDCINIKIFSDALKQLYNHSYSVDGIKDTKANVDIYHKFLGMLRYMKNYESSLKKKDYLPNYRFADEREWRYIPSDTEALLNYYPPGMVSASRFSKEMKLRLNNDLNRVRLRFDPKDVRYLIVSDDEERKNIIDYISQYPPIDPRQDILKYTTVLTYTQISTDI